MALEDAVEEQPFKKSVDSFHVSRKAIRIYGVTEGCPACRATQRRGSNGGRIGYNHSQTCRERIREAMEKDLEYQQLMKTTKQNLHAAIKHINDVIRHINNRERSRQGNLGMQLDNMMLNMLTAKMHVSEVTVHHVSLRWRGRWDYAKVGA